FGAGGFVARGVGGGDGDVVQAGAEPDGFGVGLPVAVIEAVVDLGDAGAVVGRGDVEVRPALAVDVRGGDRHRRGRRVRFGLRPGRRMQRALVDPVGGVVAGQDEFAA